MKYDYLPSGISLQNEEKQSRRRAFVEVLVALLILLLGLIRNGVLGF